MRRLLRIELTTMATRRHIAPAVTVALASLSGCQLFWPVDDYDAQGAKVSDAGLGAQAGQAGSPLEGGTAPTCTDLKQNQDETDVDCGGKHCGACAAQKKCSLDGDCATQRCLASRCEVCAQVAGWFAPSVTWAEAATADTSSSQWFVSPTGSAADVTAAVAAEDAAWAACDVVPSKDSLALRGKGFKLAVPATALIEGIEVQLRISTSGTTTNHEAIVQLLKAGAPAGANRADSAPVLPASLTWKQYGGAGDLWDETWTPADVNDAGFGVQFAAHNNYTGAASTAYVDAVSVAVTYCD